MIAAPALRGTPIGSGDPSAAPPIRRSRPRPRHHHPAGPAAIEALVHACGEPVRYGLRGIHLARGGDASGRLILGRLRVPGLIVLYDQPWPPWTLPGRLLDGTRERLERAGAIVETLAGGGQTRVAWPGETLRDFMLFDVLLHELGHHVAQQYTGKRGVRVMRTREHEAFAERFAARTRAVLAGRWCG